MPTQISTMVNSVPLMGDHPVQFKSVGVGLFKNSSLMGVFPQLLLPNSPSTYTTTCVHMLSSCTYRPHILNDTWVVPSESDIDQHGDHMPLIPTKLDYQAI